MTIAVPAVVLHTAGDTEEMEDTSCRALKSNLVVALPAAVDTATVPLPWMLRIVHTRCEWACKHSQSSSGQPSKQPASVDEGTTTHTYPDHGELRTGCTVHGYSDVVTAAGHHRAVVGAHQGQKLVGSVAGRREPNDRHRGRLRGHNGC